MGSKSDNPKRLIIPANIYFFKVSNKNTSKRCKILSKLTIKSPERRRLTSFNGVIDVVLVFFIVNFEHITEFEQVNVSCDADQV